MDFEKMARSASALLYDETGSPMPQIVETRLAEAFSAAYAAGRKEMRSEAANAADDSLPPPGRGGAKSEYVQGWLDGTDSIAAAIRALPGKDGNDD